MVALLQNRDCVQWLQEDEESHLPGTRQPEALPTIRPVLQEHLRVLTYLQFGLGEETPKIQSQRPEQMPDIEHSSGLPASTPGGSAPPMAGLKAIWDQQIYRSTFAYRKPHSS
jgi:hypothetical protein